jgi:hypothetical protein
MLLHAYDRRTSAYLGVVSTQDSAFKARPYAAELYGVPVEVVEIKATLVSARKGKA